MFLRLWKHLTLKEMKKLITSLALVLLVSAATFAQTRYTMVAYHKLQPGKTMDDAIAIEKQYLPIHEARKAAGIIARNKVFLFFFLV